MLNLSLLLNVEVLPSCLRACRLSLRSVVARSRLL
jgi:hypothetical protein